MNEAQHFVGKGFPAGLAEMEVNIKCRAVNGLYHIGRRRVRGGWDIAALHHGQEDGLPRSAGAVDPLWGGYGAGDRHAGVVGHRRSFLRCRQGQQ